MPPMNLGLGLGLSRIRGATGPAPLTLDGQPAAAFAYSVRRLLTSYTGALMRVRRSSDNTEQDIGYGVNNRLDTTALLAFAGAGSAFVVTWYDQTGNARHRSNATQVEQPRIVNAGVLEALGGQTAPWWDGVNDNLFGSNPALIAATGHTIMAVYTADPLPSDPTNNRFYYEGLGGGANPQLILGLQQRALAGSPNDDISAFLRNDAGTIVFNGTAAATQTILTDVIDVATLKSFVFTGNASQLMGYANGTAGTAQAYTRSGTFTGANTAAIGCSRGTTNTAFMRGHIAELIGWASELTTSQMAPILLNQGGAYGISVNPFLSASDWLRQLSGTGDGGSSLSVNFALGTGFAPDSLEQVFLDRAKMARGWTYEDDLGTALPAPFVDAKRDLASLPAGDTTAHFFFCSYNPSFPSYVGTPPDQGGRFRFRLETGSASAVNFTNAGTNVTQINSTTWEFDCPWTGNRWITVTPSSFPIRASLVRTTDLAAHAAGQTFRPEVLSNYPSGANLRFMGIMGTNSSSIINWSDWPQMDNQRWSRYPWELMRQLVVGTNATTWICIPHAANDDFITQMATYARDNFPGPVRFELSNELWNTGMFSQGAYFKGLAESVWGVPDGYTNPSGAWYAYAGKRFVQCMNIIYSVFAGQTSRVVGVIAGQAAATNVALQQLDAPIWRTYEPGSWVAPHTRATELAIAPYINYVGSETTTGNALKAQLDISNTAAVNYILNTMVPAGLAQAKTWIDNHVRVASDRGLRLTMYEYNQHFNLDAMSASTLYSGGNPVPGALEAMVEACYSQQMADAQDELRTYFKDKGGSLMSWFVDATPANQFGAWGAKTHLGQNSPIWNDLVSWCGANGRWYNNGGRL